MAGRIPQSFIDDLLDRTDIVDIIDGRVTLRKTGRNYSGLCPFHDEKSPSFSVSPDKQFYYCFGCGASGNAIGFLMEFDRLEFPVAVETLAKRAGVEVPTDAKSDPVQQKKQQNLYDQLLRAQQYYSQQLRQHPSRDKAVNYLKQRSLSGETAKTFAMGYAPAGWDNLSKALINTALDEQQLTQAGLLIKREDRDTHYDRFRDRIIFPIRDSRGRTIAFGGRVLGDDKPKYLNSPESPVFHKGNELYGLYEARQSNNRLARVLIVEGYMDVVALAQHGITNAVATLGTAASAMHFSKLFRMVAEVIICFDGDEAGRKAASRALETALPILEDGRQIRFLFLPDGEDPDSLVHKEGKAGFNQRLEQATPLTDYFFESVGSGLDLNTLDGQARFSKLALEKMSSMPRGMLYELMLNKLSQLTGLSADRLRETATQAPEQTTAPAGQPAPYFDDDGYTPPPEDYEAFAPSFEDQPRRDSPQRQAQRPTARKASSPLHSSPSQQAISLLLHKPELAKLVENTEVLLGICDPNVELLTQLLILLHEQPQLNTMEIIALWQGLHGQQASEDLQRLASLEQLIHEDNAQDHFTSIIQLLLKQQREQQLEQLLEHASHTPLTKDEKQQLQALLLEKHGKIS